MLSQRSQQSEWIDLGPSYYSEKEYRECLYQLDRIGKLLGGDKASFWAFNQLKHSPNSILDVGCGGGLCTIRLAEHYPQAQILGIDISQTAINIANENLQNSAIPLPHVKFAVPSSPQLDYAPHQFDVVTATLLCHHLSDQELVDFLRQACKIAKHAVIINDLHRSPLAFLSFALIAPLVFHNRLIFHDGLISIRRAFTKKDWYSYLAEAGLNSNQFTVTWHWAFRWIVMIHPSGTNIS